MHIHLLGIRRALRRIPISNLQFSRLVIRAVGARYKLLVLALEGEPGLEVVLFRCGVVERAGDDGDDAVGELEGFVEFFGRVDHAVEFGPGFVGFAEDKLFDLE